MRVAAIDEGVDVIRRAVKRSGDAVEELMEDSATSQTSPGRNNRCDVGIWPFGGSGRGNIYWLDAEAPIDQDSDSRVWRQASPRDIENPRHNMVNSSHRVRSRTSTPAIAYAGERNPRPVGV